MKHPAEVIELAKQMTRWAWDEKDPQYNSQLYGGIRGADIQRARKQLGLTPPRKRKTKEV